MRNVLTRVLALFFSCTWFPAEAQAIGDPQEGRVRFLSLCSACHGVPPDHRAIQAANNPDTLSSALSSVSSMGSIAPLISRNDIVNIAAYLGDNQLNQSVTGVRIQGDGTGTVVSSPVGIDCGGVCVWNFAPSTPVILRATPRVGSRFVGWSDSCTGTADCRLTISQAQTVTARFKRNGPLRDHSGMWWVGVSENGWGMAINQRVESGQQFNKLYV